MRSVPPARIGVFAAVAGQPNRQQLDRDLSPESGVVGEPDFTHAVGAKGVDELVVIDASA